MLEPTPETRAPEAGPSSGSGGPTSIEHLDNLCRLMEKLGELRDHNSQLQRRVQYLEDLKGLRGHAEAGTATAEEAIMKATEERFLGPASSSNARPFVKIGKRSGKFKPLQYSMSHTFGEEGAKRKESKWSKVKGALGLDRSSMAILKQTSPCSSAGQSPQVKRSPLKPVEPDSSRSSSSEELDPYFTLTDITPDYDAQAASTNSQPKLEEGYRRSKSLEGEALFNHLRGVSTCQRSNRTPWGVVKGLIKTAKSRHENVPSRLSYPSEAPENDVDTAEVIPAVDVHNTIPEDNHLTEARDEFTNGQCRLGSTGLRRPSKWSKVKSAFLSGPVGPASPIASSPNSPNRHSSFVYDPDWDVSEEGASVPKDEIRRSYLNLQQRLSQEFQRKRMNWERGVGVISENTPPLEDDEEPVTNIYGEASDLSSIKKSSTSVSIVDDQPYRNQVNQEGRDSLSSQPAGLLAWQRLRKSRTVPAVPLTEITNGTTTKTKITNDNPVVPESCSDSQERGLRWLQKELSRVEREKMRLERERDRVLRREAKQRRQEVLVRTSGGLFRFQGISHQFTRRLFEWEKSQGIPPQDSTLALLHPEYADSTDVSNKLARSRSEGIVGARVPQTDEDESSGVRNKILRFENNNLNKMDGPPKLLRPKDFKSRFSERYYHDEGDINSSSTTQDKCLLTEGRLSLVAQNLHRTFMEPSLCYSSGSQPGGREAVPEKISQRILTVATSKKSASKAILSNQNSLSKEKCGLPISCRMKRETADSYGLNEGSTGIPKSRFRPKVRARGKFIRQNAETENNFVTKQTTNTEENQDQRQAAVLVSALSTQLLTLAQELEASLGAQPTQTQSNCNVVHLVQPKLNQCPDDVTPLPTLLTNTVLQLRQGLKVLCKDHAGSSSNLTSCPEPEKIPSILSIDKEDIDEEDEEDDGEDDEDEDDTANIRRYANKRKLRKSSRKMSCNDPVTPSADVFVSTTRRIFSPITHEAVRSVVTYVVDEPTKDSDSSSTASSDQSERVCSPAVPVPVIPTSTTTLSATTPSLSKWRTPNVRNVCSIVAPAWLRTSGSRSQSSSPATRRRLTPPALPQSPGSTRRDNKETAAPSIRMMIAKYNQTPNPTENGVAVSAGSWKPAGIEKRVRLQMERYEQGIRLGSSGCVQKSASAGAIQLPGILKSSSVGSIKPRVIPSVMAARIRNLRIQRAKLEFLSRASPESAVPLIKSASESVIEYSKPAEAENHGGPDASPKMGVGWRLRRMNRSIDEESPGTNVVSTGMTKSCPSSPVLERIGAEEKEQSGRSPVGWMKLPGRLFRQK